MRVLDVLSGALLGALVTILLIGDGMTAERHNVLRDGIFALNLVLLVVRAVLERRRKVAVHV